ncbi:MAG: 3-deoxy-7-phosphoheptulonate synthase [Fibrobacteres bacterium]|jgi:3-deoxy-7-phosphoheptulonate synthase|nr:3-deoxy-7-phosphoheptulonate synthase [Fibrobacterota bacterium]
MQATENLNIREIVPLIPPGELKRMLPMDEAANATVLAGRKAVQEILSGTDKRILAIVGPCSIHDTDGALEYARRFKGLRDQVADRICLLMRVYFEKPRTTVGWKGFINDPFLDESGDISTGVREARRLLLQINGMGIPAASEFLDPIVPQYIADLVAWAAIGARTTESQTHRQMASGLSMPVGFKNGTDGNIQVAVDALISARFPHNFLGLDSEGRTAIVKTKGNPYGHIVLRGGKSKTNYDAESIAEAVAQLRKASLETRVVVDCSHGNTQKRHELQEEVWKSVVAQKAAGNAAVVGAMVESNLFGGSQKIPGDRSQLKYGVSITDECIGWETTERMILEAYQGLA